MQSSFTSQLVDQILKAASKSIRLKQECDSQSNNTTSESFSSTISEDQDLGRIMDSGELEKERGITITSKVTRLHYFSNRLNRHCIINVVDTPGRSHSLQRYIITAKSILHFVPILLI